MNGDEIFAWQLEIVGQLRDSAWAPALDIDGFDALDLLMTPIFTELQAETRGRPAAVQAPSLAGRALATLRRRKLPGPLAERLARSRSAPVEGGEIVFWPREPTHLNQLLPVVRELRTQASSCRFVACNPRIFDQLRQAGESPIFTRGAWADALEAAREQGQESWRALPQDPTIELPTGPLARENLLAALRRALRLLPLAHESIAVSRRVISDLSPRAVVAGNDLTVEGRALALVATAESVASYSLMHGTVNSPAHGHHRVDRFLIYGEAARQTLHELGIPDRQLAVVGCPALDARPTQSHQPLPTVRPLLDGRPDRWILIATSGAGHSVSHQHHQQLVETLARLSAELPDVNFLAKLHRKDQLHFYEAARRLLPESRLRVVPNGASGVPSDIFDWLQGCPLLVTGASTVALEAMLMGVPVVTVDLAGELRDVDFIEAGATTHATDADALFRAISTALDHPQELAETRQRAERFTEQVYGPLDGQASARAAREILRLSATTSK